MAEQPNTSLSDTAWDVLGALARIDRDEVALLPVAWEFVMGELVERGLVEPVSDGALGTYFFAISDEGRALWENRQ